MEYLTGRPLDEVLHDRGPLPPTEAIPLIIEVLGALSAAHGVGVIHRDLKPGNLFVVQESNGTEYMKVLDFGLAKQAAAPNASTPQTRASMIVGTPDYMAPEQACGQAVSPRTDLYAVGIILFEMLTGRLPFQAATPMQVAIHRCRRPRPRRRPSCKDCRPSSTCSSCACWRRIPSTGQPRRKRWCAI
ncbi:serine/threonine-protein kinase [Cystobacter fuscus]